MAQDEISTNQKIIMAVISCIEKEGVHSVTTRSIAREAGVNIAAINYYFGSKEKLVEEAFEYITKDFMMDCRNIIERKDSSKQEIINEFLDYIFTGCIGYPNVMRAFFYDPFINNKYDSPMVKVLNEVMNMLYERLSGDIDERNKDELKNVLLETITSCMFIGIFPDYFNKLTDMDPKNPENLSRYVEKLTKNIIYTMDHLPK